MPRELGDIYVWVNIPEFMLRVVKNGRSFTPSASWSASSMTQTPIFSRDMEQIIFHPFWGVPESIKKQESCPAWQRRPAFSRATVCACSIEGRDIDPESCRLAHDRHPRRTHLPAAGRQQRARRREVPLPQQARRLHARHARKEPVRGRRAHVQPWLHARAQPAEIGGAAAGRGPGLAAGACAFGSRSPWRTRRTTRSISRHKIPVHITYFTASVDDDGNSSCSQRPLRPRGKIALGLEGKTNLIPHEGGPSSRVIRRDSASRQGGLALPPRESGRHAGLESSDNFLPSPAEIAQSPRSERACPDVAA